MFAAGGTQEKKGPGTSDAYPGLRTVFISRADIEGLGQDAVR